MSKVKEIVLDSRYTPEKYPTYDNYPAIDVSKTKDIPVDFMGLMGVPVSFLDMPGYQHVFEIIGMSGFAGEVYTPGLPGGRLKLNGKETFRRILIRRKLMAPERMWISNEAATTADGEREGDRE